MKERAKKQLEGAMDIDDINIISRDLETDELRERCKGIIKARHSDHPREEEIQRWARDESTVEISRASHQPIQDITRKVKEKLKTIMREMGV